MDSICTRFAIALVFTLTHEFASGCSGGGVTCERPEIFAEVVTSFRKDPWINFHSSWEDGVSVECRNDVTTLYQGVNAGDMWALRMLDAASGIPSGILMGNIVDLGAYDECVGVKGHDNAANIQGRHCMVSFSIPSKFIKDAPAVLYHQKLSTNIPNAGVQPGLTLSVCLPSSCSVENVFGLVNASIQSTPQFVAFEVNVTQVRCSRVGSTDNLTTGTILTVSLFAVIVGLLLSCTVCDFVVKARSGNGSPALRTLAKFSLYTNAMKLLSTEVTPGTIPAIHGLRFLSTCHLLSFHRGFVALNKPLVNLSDIKNMRQSVTLSFGLMGPFAVETFFVISGFLVTRTFLKKMRSSVKFNLLEFYVHRYIRLTPCIGVLLLFVIFIFPYFVSGPLARRLSENSVKLCQKNWLMDLFHLQNLVYREGMCLRQTWHVAADTQYFILSPIVLYPLFYRPKLGLAMLGILLTASFITPALQIVNNHYPFLGNPTETPDDFDVHFMTYNRASPYFIGIFLGYDSAINKERVTKVQAVFGWILACIFMVFCFSNSFFIQPSVAVYNFVPEMVYLSVGRFVWSAAMAWIIYACTRGYGGPATRLLSLPIFMPLSRLSYVINLIHVLVQGYDIVTPRTAEFYSTTVMISQICGDLAFCIAAAFILHLCIETPPIILYTAMTVNQPAAISNHAPAKKTDNLSFTTNEYFDQIKSQVTSDLVGGTQMAQMSFWRTVSDVLNTLSKRASKTPAEWAKTWWEWRSNSLGKSHPEYIHSKAAQFETTDSTPERELFIFLIAVAHGLDDTASFIESNNIELTSCQLDSHDLQKTGDIRTSTSGPDSIDHKISGPERRDTQSS